MAKGPKLRVSILNSFHMCRPKDPTSLIKSPVPKMKHVLSPVNSKSFDISIPSSPIPPSSTPNHPFSKRSVVPLSISPLGCESSSNSCNMHRMTSELEDEFSSLMYSRARKEDKGKMHCTFPISCDSDELTWATAPSRVEKTKIKKSKGSASTRASSVYSEESQETDSLFSSPPSFNSFNDRFNHPLKTIIEEEPYKGSKKSMKQSNARTRRFTRFGSKDWKDGVVTDPEREEKQISGRLMPFMVDGKVNQSFVVVKKSVDPYKDFKKSMLEMILEKQIFEPKELEHLLMSFLSLNSRIHHKVIIEAFAEIWKEVFSG